MLLYSTLHSFILSFYFIIPSQYQLISSQIAFKYYRQTIFINFIFQNILTQSPKMKAENSQSHFDSTQLSIQSLTNDMFIKCCQNNKALEFCIEEKCSYDNVFSCSAENCLCYRQHQACAKGQIKYALKTINSKIQKTDDLKLYIDQTIDSMIDQLSKLRQQLIQEVDKKLKYSQLDQVEKKFLLISENLIDFSSIRFEHTASLWKILKQKKLNKNKILELQKQLLQQFKDNSSRQILNLKQQIQKLTLTKPTSINTNPLIVQSSSILTNAQLSVRLVSMFSRKIKKIDVIFKASQHNFSLLKYYEICGSVENTIVLALTNKDKIFGGFTPFCFYSGKDEWVIDSEKQSFLFSLSQNQKFNLTDGSNRCIYRCASKQQYIRFGGDFYIFTNANTNRNNVTGNKCSYASNPKYNKDKQSYLKLNGNQSTNCTLKEWEVLKLQFQ